MCRVPELGVPKPTIKRSKPPRHLRPENPLKIESRLHLHKYADPSRIHMSTGRPRLCSDSYEARSMGSLDPRNFRLVRPKVESVDPSSSTYLLTKAFNATTPTNVATEPPAWEQHLCLIPHFTAHPRMGGEKAATIHTTSTTVVPSTPPRRSRRQPLRPGFLGLSVIHSSSTTSATSLPSLDRCRSTKEQRSHVGYRGPHARHRT
jgi:hypothetical protein